MNLDFNKIIYFLKVSEKSSISEAARELFISPQALNKQISALEKEVGKKLFLRTTRSLTLTEAGTFFRNQMLPIFQLYQTAQEEIAHHFSEKKKQLKFEFFQGISKRYIVLPILNELMVLLPDIQLELSTAEMDTILDDVRENKADLAVTNIHECEDVGELKILPLLNIPGSVVISYLHPWMAKEFITAEDMSAMPVLYLSRKAGPDTKGFYGQLKASAYRFAPTYNAMLAQLELGKEYSVFPALFENIKDSGFKTFKLPPEFHINHTISLIYREDNPYAGYFEALTLLKKEIETQAEFLKIRI